MSLSSLINGADCGPSNALQSLTKRVDADRGIQSDFFGAARAGSSKQVFRTQTAPNSHLQSEQASFFNASARPMLQPPVAQGPFDLSAMGHALNTRPESTPSPMVQTKGKGKMVDWAADFLQQGVAIPQQADPMQMHHTQQVPSMQPLAPMNQFMRPDIGLLPMRPPPVMSQRPIAPGFDAAKWEEQFLAQHRSLEETAGQTAENPVHVESDELSRTAGLLVDTLKDEANPKFKNSQFMGFMRQLRDKEMVVDGDDIVPASEATTKTTISNTDSTSTPSTWRARERTDTIDGWPMKSVHFDPVTTTATTSQAQEGATEVTEEISEEDAYWQAENRDYKEYWERAASLPAQQTMTPATATEQAREWGALQESWDQWEATATGVKQTALPNYSFQRDNPYTFDTLGALRSGQNVDQNLLEREAEVLKDPQNAEAWYQLGIKQQSNEREDKAIQALRKAVELDPSLLNAWMELSVSYTNEGNRAEAYRSIQQWIERNPRYTNEVFAWKIHHTFSNPPSIRELTDCLVAMATSTSSSDMDPEVQIALGVLLNTTEEYEKATDCFLAALDARPDDPLLYNRIGATMANHGQAKKALPYYHRALELNPAYIRARFNLGISYISVQRYEEAAELILDALVLQENDGLERGVTSSVLWETLRNVCLHLHRHDLAKLCNRRDLTGFRTAFFTEK